MANEVSVGAELLLEQRESHRAPTSEDELTGLRRELLAQPLPLERQRRHQGAHPVEVILEPLEDILDRHGQHLRRPRCHGAPARVGMAEAHCAARERARTEQGAQLGVGLASFDMAARDHHEIGVGTPTSNTGSASRSSWCRER